MKRKMVITIITFLLISMSATGLAREYYLYDHEQNEILSLKDDLKGEALKTIGLTKNPDIMMATGISQQYLAVFNSIELRKEKGPVFFQPGKMVVYDTETGRTADFLEIGFAPYQWIYTKDRLQFFIAYYQSPKKDVVEILHYNIKTKKGTRLTGIARQVTDLGLTYDEKGLLAITDSGKPVQELVKFQIAPFQQKSELELGGKTERLYILGPDRAALLSFNKRRSRKSNYGSIKIIDTYGNTVVEERKLFHPYTGVYWHEENLSLFVTNGLLSENMMEGRIYKVTEAGIRQHQMPRPWAGFSYFPQQDRLYVLNDTSLTLVDYSDNFSRSFKLSSKNYYPGRFDYYFQSLPQTNMAIIACFDKGYLKFYDLDKNQVLKDSTCGRSGKRFLNSISFKGDLQSQTAITTNQWQSRYYVLNRATQDITVYDQEFDIMKYLVPNEPPLAMFQINQPKLQTLVVTAKGLFKIDEEKVDLVPVAKFSVRISRVNYLEEKEGSVFIYTDGFLMALEPEELQVIHCFYLYGDPDQKYTKLSNSERRYYFIPEM